jgi:HEAT repeat protein
MDLTKMKKPFWQIPVLLILSLTVLEIWYPGTVPVLREVTVQWKIICLNRGDPRAAFSLGEMGPKATRAVPALIKALDSDAEAVRGTAAMALGKIGPKAVPALIKALDSSRREVRDVAARALGDIGPAAESAIPSLVRIQKEDRERDGDTRGGHTISGALVALGKIGERGLEPFITDLRHKDPQVREHAAKSLGTIMRVVPDERRQLSNAQKSIGPLINALQDDDVRVRSAAAMAMHGVLPAVKDPQILGRAAEALVRAMKDRAVAPSGAGALLGAAGRGLEPILAIIENADVRGQRVDPSVESPTSRGTTVERLIRIMADREEMLGFGTLALENIGEPALEPLINALQDEEVRVRRAAVMALQFVLPAVEDPNLRAKALKPLIRAMNDNDSQVRGYASVALGKIGEPALEPLLQIVLEQDKQDTVERALTAASALSQILRTGKHAEFGRRVMELLVAALKDDRPKVRKQAATALGVILEYSDLRDPAMRQTVVASLLKALQDDSHEVQTRAAIALDQILSHAAGRAGTEINGRTIEALLTALQDGSPNRRFVANALGSALAAGAEPGFQQRATASLLSRLEDRKESDSMRAAAIGALGRIIFASKSLESARTVVPLLIRALEDERQGDEGDSLRFHASLALGRVVSAVADPKLARKAVPPLITALQDKNPSVRGHAAKSLGRIFAAAPDPELAETAVQPLLAALEDAKWPYQRNDFAWALIQIGTQKVKDAVRNAGFDPDRPPSLPTEGY